MWKATCTHGRSKNRRPVYMKGRFLEICLAQVFGLAA